jgi:Putative transposase
LAPIAEHCFVKITDGEVQFRTKDLRQRQVVTTQYAATDFVAALGEHVQEHYRHAIRYFGLLAPKSKGQTSAGRFALLRQQKRKVSRLGWAALLRKHFNVDPLLDKHGRAMRWVGRTSPTSS